MTRYLIEEHKLLDDWESGKIPEAMVRAIYLGTKALRQSKELTSQAFTLPRNSQLHMGYILSIATYRAICM